MGFCGCLRSVSILAERKGLVNRRGLKVLHDCKDRIGDIWMDDKCQNSHIRRDAINRVSTEVIKSIIPN